MQRTMPESNWRGKRVTVMGLGSFGGGLGVCRFFAERGARVTVTDLRPAEELRGAVDSLSRWPEIAFHLGGHSETDFRKADLVVVNPAVPADSPYLAIARTAGVPLTTEIVLFWQHCRGRMAAVTGSNGKSTTTAMLAGILKAAGGAVHLGGNIGVSLLPDVERIGAEDWVVLELSSFQLEMLDALHAAPDVAVVTNFSPNHLDRHGTLDAYRSAKQALLRWQHSGQHAVLNADDADVSRWAVRGRRWCFGERDTLGPGLFLHDAHARFRGLDGATEILPLPNWVKLPGRHNLRNALAAACAARAVGASAEAVRAGLESYAALPHRLQLVAEGHGRRFYNDSLATTPESAAAAVAAFDVPVVLLAGGYDKGVELSPLVDALGPHVKAIALMGQTGGALEELIRRRFEQEAGQPARPRCARCDTFDDAFGWAVAQSSLGDVVLLSPACASYDWFRNFVERGERFTELAVRFAQSEL